MSKIIVSPTDSGYQFVYQVSDTSPSISYIANLTEKQVSDRQGPDAVAAFIKSKQDGTEQDGLQSFANNAPKIDPNQSGLLVNGDTGTVIDYGPKYPFQVGNETTQEKAQILGEPYMEQIPVIQEIKSISDPNVVEGYSYKTKIPVDGPLINPYSGVNPNKNATTELYETIGGSDLSLFMIMEVTTASDLGLPEAIQKKEILTIEMENALSLSYSTIRERYPVRVLGEINPRAMTRGIRTISGHIAFGVFTKDILQYLRGRISEEVSQIEASFDSYKPQSRAASADVDRRYDEWLQQKQAYSAISNKVQLLDDLPLFHILCMGTNENGIFSKFMIKNVSIIDENQYQGTQQPNIINKVNWVAQDLIPMNEVEKWNQKTVLVSSVSSIESSYSNGKYGSNINYNTDITGSTLLDSMLNDLGGN
jgi:hypothetical protein